MDIKVRRLDSARLLINWVPVVDPGGFVDHYKIMTGNMDVFTVPMNVSHIVLSVRGVYAFRIATVNGNRVIGRWSQWTTNKGKTFSIYLITNNKNSFLFITASKIIQLRGGPFKSCVEWSVSYGLLY